MNGFIKQTAVVLSFGLGVLALVGCSHYRNLVDPCWPERYNQVARYSVRDMHNVQADKGHVLNQTVWHDDFEGNNLKPSGKAKLNYVAHREPAAAVMKVYLQSAAIEDRDKRETANAARKKVVLAYLASQRSGTSNTLYDVEVHNYEQPTYRSDWTEKGVLNIERNIRAGQPQIFITPTVSGTK